MYRVSIVCCILYSSLAFALPSDSKQKLHITSDTSTYNYKSGINVFEGNVHVDQGTSHIIADKLITKSNGAHKVQEAVAYGLLQPAHYWTLPGNSKPVINAHAGIIKYYPLAANVVLERNAYVVQGKNIFKGQLVTYNMNEEVIHVPASISGKSILVYNPDEDDRDTAT